MEHAIVLDRRRSQRSSRLTAILEAEAAERRMADAVADWNVALVRDLAPTLHLARTVRGLIERTA